MTISLRESFLRFDDRLAVLGVPPLTAWWREGIGRWLDAYEAAQVLELVGCVGRGAAKSTALYKLALFFSLFGDFSVPIGERHFAVVLSRLKEEASKGIAIVARWLDLLGIPHRVAGDVIELVEMPRGIRVVAASVAASSGWRAFFVGKDERSKWPAGGVDDLDGSEIDTSAAAMTATHALAPVVAFGSAWGDFGGFYDAVLGGSNDVRIVLGPTPTWVAAPHITEESTRRKETDPKRHAREYGCVFGLGSSSALDVEALRACVREIYAEPLHGPEIVIDSSGGKFDAFVVAVFTYVSEVCDAPVQLMEDLVTSTGDVVAGVVCVRDASGYLVPNPDWHPPKPRLVLSELYAWEGAIAESLSTGDVADAIAGIARRVGASRVHGDQYGAWSWSSDLRKRGLVFEEHPWSAPAKTDAILRLRQLIRERILVISPQIGPEAESLIREASTFEERMLPSGALSFSGRGRAHDDRVMTLMLAARVDAEGRLRGSPLSRSSHRHEILDHDDVDELDA